MVSKESVFDKNGQETANLTEGSVNSTKEIFYNRNQQPDSIISESSMPFSRYRQYYKYDTDGSYMLLTIYKDYTDTLFIDKDQSKIRQQSSDGSTITYEYNSRKQLVKQIDTDETGKKSIKVFTYDAQGRVLKESLTADPGTILTTDYVYNAKGKILSKKFTGTGGYAIHNGASTYLYNSIGLLIKESAVKGTFKYSEAYVYEFYQ